MYIVGSIDTCLQLLSIKVMYRPPLRIQPSYLDPSDSNTHLILFRCYLHNLPLLGAAGQLAK